MSESLAPSELKADSPEVRRAKHLEGLRKLADLMEAHPELELPYNLRKLETYVYTVEDVAKWAKALPGKKSKQFEETSFKLQNDLGLGGFERLEHGYYTSTASEETDEAIRDMDNDELTVELLATRQSLTYEQREQIDEFNKAAHWEERIAIHYGPVTIVTVPYFPISIMANRDTVCERVVVATKTEMVDVYPDYRPIGKVAQEVDIVRWDCKPILNDE